MNILLANNTLDILAGSETWTLTMAKELVNLGHKVSAYSDKLGFIAMRLEEIGVKCYRELTSDTSLKPFDFVLHEESTYDFDVIICNHHHITGYLRKKFPKTPIIATIHGILHKNTQTGEIYPEHPNLEANVDRFVAVSEEVQSLLKDVYKIDAELIRNPFDLETFFYKPADEGTDKNIKTIMINTNYQGKDDPGVQLIKQVADHYGAQVRAVGANFQPTYEIEHIIKDCDVIVGMGRSVLEGVAMGKIGLVHGRWGTGGVITPETVEKLAWYNYSGRNSNGEVKTVGEIVALIDAANTRSNGDAMYEYMTRNHDVRVVAKKYLELAEELIKTRESKENAF